MKQTVLLTLIVPDQLLYTTSALHLFVNATASFHFASFLQMSFVALRGGKDPEQLLTLRSFCKIQMFPYLLSHPTPGRQIAAAEISSALPTPLTRAATGFTPTAAPFLPYKPPGTPATQIWNQQKESSSSWSSRSRSGSCRSSACSHSQFTALTSTPAMDRSNAAARLSLSSPGLSLQVRKTVVFYWSSLPSMFFC